jgi:hypothetical protein
MLFLVKEKCVPDLDGNVRGESGGIAGMDKIDMSAWWRSVNIP